MRITESRLQSNIAYLFNNSLINLHQLPFQFNDNLVYLHRLFVSAFFFQNKSCQKRILNVDASFDKYKKQYIDYYNKKKELKKIIRSLKFAIQHAKIREKKSFLQKKRSNQ